MSSHSPTFSVVIPVLNDENVLPRCLDALEHQSLPRDGFEVIVVDNGSRRGVAEVMGERFSWVRFVAEARPGSYMARNAGVRAAKGRYVAFTDADCVPDPDWLRNAQALFEREPAVAYIAGRINLFPRQPGKENLAERFEIHTAFRQQDYLENSNFGATANVIVNREVIEREVGWFDEAAQRGDDVHWGRAVFAGGLRQRYADEVLVCHPARHSLKLIVNKYRREYGRLFYLALRDLDGRGRWWCLWSHLRRDVPLPRGRYRWWLAGERRNHRTIATILVVGTVIHYSCLLEKARLTLGGQPLPR